MNVYAELAATVATGLGSAVPAALSLSALSGDDGIRTRKVAILAADAVHGRSIMAMFLALAAAGASPCVIAPRLGRVKTADREPLKALATLESSAPVLFDALVLPHGVDGVADLAGYDKTMDFIRDQYRHGKPILALGASKILLASAGISAVLPSGERNPGILLARDDEDASAAFIAAVSQHRHTGRVSTLL